MLIWSFPAVPLKHRNKTKVDKHRFCWVFSIHTLQCWNDQSSQNMKANRRDYMGNPTLLLKSSCESSLSLLEARKLPTIPRSRTGIPGLAKIVGHGEVNKLAHTLENQVWTPCTSRHDVCYKNATTCSSGLDLQHCQILTWELLQYFILPSWDVSAWGVEKTGPCIYPSFNSLELPLPHLPQQLSPLFLPFCPETATITHFRTPTELLLYGRQRDMTGSPAARQREGREEIRKKKKASPAMSSTRTGIWLFWLCSLLEKLCHISGERCRVRQLPAGPCRLKWPQECTQVAPGLRA